MRFVTTANNSVPVFSTGGFAVSLFSDMTSASKPLFINKGLLQSDRNLFGFPFSENSFIIIGNCLFMPRNPVVLDYRGILHNNFTIN